jgi:hypothetical protein
MTTYSTLQTTDPDMVIQQRHYRTLRYGRWLKTPLCFFISRPLLC